MDRFDSSGSGFNSSGSGSSNPFAGPSIAVIRDIPIAERVPVKLSTTAANFFPWKTYFGLLFREYDLLDHVDGTIDLLAMPHDPEWLAIDATIIRWFYQTVSNDIFRTVVRDGDSAHTVWTKITGLFTDNKIQRVTFLQQEFFGTHQNDLCLDDYALKLKSLSDELRDLEFLIDDKIMLSTLSAGLGEDLSNAASNLTLLTTPTFEQAVAYLRLEERRLKHLRARAAHTAFVANFSRGASTPAPRAPAPRPMGPPLGFPAAGHQAGQTGPWTGPSGQQAGQTGPWTGHAGAQAGQTGTWTGQAAPSGGGRRGRRRRGGGGNGGGNAGVNVPAPRPPQHTAPPPWTAGHNPWTGVVHAYSMPVPRAPYPGIMGPRPATHQAFYAAPQPAPAYAAPPGATPWDPALLTALQSAPSAGAYGGGGDWFMDTGASAHMAAHPDVAATLTAFFAFVSTQFGRPIHALQTDNGKEFDNITIRSLLTTHGAVFRLTCPYTSSQNGRAERMLRTLNDCVRTLLFHASMPPRFWPDALATATLLVNIRPCRVRWSYTPHHLLYGAPPAYDDLRIFGCRCYPNTAATAAHKLAPRSLPCVFLGYPANTKGYRCYLTSRHVYFDELVFPFQQGLLVTPPTTPPAPTGPPAAARRRLTAAAPSAPAPPGPLASPSPPAPPAPTAPPAPPSPASPATPEAPPAPQSPAASYSAASSSTASSPASPPVAAAPEPMLTRARAGVRRPSTRYPRRPVRLHGVSVHRVCLLGQRQQHPAARRRRTFQQPARPSTRSDRPGDRPARSKPAL
ncbi:hypothetical protein ACQ4PT_006722 [Festuca glaucescens]